MSNKRNKPNRRRNSWEDRESRDMRDDAKQDKVLKKSSNAAAWYGSDPALLRDAASFPFSYPMGKTYDMGVHSTVRMHWNQPGICVVRVVPTFGTLEGPGDALNVASQSIYSFIRHANSGHANYDSPDLMLYILAMSSVYSFINFAQRIYGEATLYAQKNRYMPRTLLLADGMDPDDVVANLANFRYRLNTLINKASAFAVPNSMSIFARHAFLYQSVYLESADIKDQLYMYSPEAFWIFKRDETTGEGYLDMHDWQNSADDTLVQHTVDELMTFGEEMFQAIWDEEDMGIMSGDILKAYGDNIIKVTSVPEFYPVVPIYDEVVLNQIHNTHICFVGGNGIRQNDSKNALVCTPTINTSVTDGEFESMKQVLTVPASSPEPDYVMESTRMMVVTEPYTDGSETKYKIRCGTEVAKRAYYYTLREDGNTVFSQVQRRSIEATGLNNNLVAAATAFRFHPQLCHATNTGEYYYMGNVDNFTILDNTDLKKLHEAAQLNMLNVPSIAKLSSDLSR